MDLPALNTVEFYDNGGESADRYTAVYTAERNPRNGLYACLGMSADPFHPQGVGMHGECQRGEHLGTPIAFSALPPDCQKAIIQDLTA